MTIESRLVKAGAIRVEVSGRSPAYQLGSKLIWILPGEKQVLLGYAHSPQQQGVRLSLSAALRA